MSQDPNRLRRQWEEFIVGFPYMPRSRRSVVCAAFCVGFHCAMSDLVKAIDSRDPMELDRIGKDANEFIREASDGNI